jgi:hypothetical protein
MRIRKLLAQAVSAAYNSCNFAAQLNTEARGRGTYVNLFFCFIKLAKKCKVLCQNDSLTAFEENRKEHIPGS